MLCIWNEKVQRLKHEVRGLMHVYTRLPERGQS